VCPSIAGPVVSLGIAPFPLLFVCGPDNGNSGPFSKMKLQAAVAHCQAGVSHLATCCSGRLNSQKTVIRVSRGPSEFLPLASGGRILRHCFHPYSAFCKPSWRINPPVLPRKRQSSGRTRFMTVYNASNQIAVIITTPPRAKPLHLSRTL
jgi:hypothetical protein